MRREPVDADDATPTAETPPLAGEACDVAGEPSRRRGRRAGASGFRDSILRSARELFAERGYAGATTRSIAMRAGVDPALIVHFFGGKDELFATASLRPAGSLTAVLEGFAEGPGDAGERLALAYLGPWEAAATAAPLLAIARSALAHEGAMDQLRTLLLPPSTTRAVRALGKDTPEYRVALAMSHLYGVAMARHVIKLPALVAPSLEELVDAVAPAVQHSMTGPLTRQR